jgi:chaperone modulatory protein CbpM
MKKTTFTWAEVSSATGLDQKRIRTSIENQWVIPEEEMRMDQEDISRLQLIENLRHDFGVNDEAIPLILHLIDQLYDLRARVRALRLNH